MSDWREGKSLVECHRHMLDKEIFCDVTLEVGPEDGATELIRAHKYMLAARREVFLAMFSSELREAGEIVRIVDIEAADFRHMLRFIYTDDTNLTAENITGQMYAAEKYILSGLINLCEQWMEQNIDSENACAIMQCAELYNREDLLNVARDYILQNASEVLQGPGFVKVAQNNLKMLVAHDELHADEDVIYEACVKWAQHQVSEKEEEASGLAIREALGDCFQLIRFPIIEHTKMVQLMKRFPNVLTKDEEISVMRNLIDGSDTPFSNARRRSLKTYYLCRFNRFRDTWNCNDGKPDAISFTCDSLIWLKGITIYGYKQGSHNDIEVEVLTDDGCVIYKEPRKQLRFSRAGASTNFFFEKDVRISSGKQYTIVQKVWGGIIYRGDDGRDRVVWKQVTFNFSDSDRSENGTKVSRGQIPGLLFSKR